MKPDDEIESSRRDTPGVGRTESAKERTPGPRLPYERDESSDTQPAPPAPQREIGERAFEDAQSKREDTGRLPATDAAYHAQTKRPR